jgi:hypothetical protein
MQTNQISIVRLKSLDTYRDGGSVSASFEESEHCTATLMFRIRMGMNDANQLVKKGYKVPTLDRSIKVERISPVTGKANVDWDRSSEEIFWEVARAILRKLEPLVPSLESDYKEVFPSMIVIANAEGKSE